MDHTIVLYITFLVLFIIILAYKWYTSPLRKTQRMRIPQDDNIYYVQDAYKDKEEAAAMMSMLNKKILDVLLYMKKKKESGLYNYSPYLEGVVGRVLNNWNPERLYESPPTAPGTSYTVAKGQKTVFCLRSKTNASIHSIDDMLFVGLHELSHMGDLNWGHKESFWEVFKFILHEAQEAGVYTPKNYGATPIVYCGLNINYSPLYDPNVKVLWQ